MQAVTASAWSPVAERFLFRSSQATSGPSGAIACHTTSHHRPYAHLTSTQRFRSPENSANPSAQLSSCNILSGDLHWFGCASTQVAESSLRRSQSLRRGRPLISASLEVGPVGDGKSLQLKESFSGGGHEAGKEGGGEEKKKVVVVGAGWAGLGAAHHLIKQARRKSF